MRTCAFLIEISAKKKMILAPLMASSVMSHDIFLFIIMYDFFEKNREIDFTEKILIPGSKIGFFPVKSNFFPISLCYDGKLCCCSWMLSFLLYTLGVLHTTEWRHCFVSYTKRKS